MGWIRISKKNFQPLLKDFAVKPTCMPIRNPQANAILEHIHQVVGCMLVAARKCKWMGSKGFGHASMRNNQCEVRTNQSR